MSDQLSASSDAAAREELSAALDHAVAKLSSTDRTAIVLRYFQGKSTDEVATALSVTPDAARKRLDRAVVKLRAILARLGVSTSTPALSAFLLGRAITHAPPHVASSVAATIASASAGTTTGAAGVIAKGALVATSVKSTSIAAVVILLLLLGLAARFWR